MSEKPWGKPAEGPTFNEKYPTEFRTSAVPDAGNGWWAKVDIPKGTRLRRVTVKDGSLIKIVDLDALKASGWSVEDSVHYGIGHRKDTTAVYFLNPGTACNHADPTRETSIRYHHDEKDVFELWTVKDIKAGEEMFINYGESFARVPWFEELHLPNKRTPLANLGPIIDLMVLGIKDAAEGAVDMKVSLKKPKGFYTSAARSFLKGVEAKPAKDGKEAVEAKPAVNDLRISGVGDAVNVAIAAASAIEEEGTGQIARVQTNYTSISGKSCPQIFIDVKKK